MIVHGGWGGGWKCSGVAQSLRELGHNVLTPTLTGMGERADAGHAELELSTHVADVVELVECEDLHQVVLCGHSYGGMPVTGAADRLTDRIGLLIYIYALVPGNGQSVFDLVPATFKDLAQASADAHGDRWRVPIPPWLLPSRGLGLGRRMGTLVARLRDQPLATFAEPLQITGAVDRLRRAFVRCTGDQLGRDIGGDPIARRRQERAARAGSTVNSMRRTTRS